MYRPLLASQAARCVFRPAQAWQKKKKQARWPAVLWNTKFYTRHTHFVAHILVDVDVHNRRIDDAIILIWSYLIRSQRTFFGTWLVFLSFTRLERHLLDFLKYWISTPFECSGLTRCDQDMNATLFQEKKAHRRGQNKHNTSRHSQTNNHNREPNTPTNNRTNFNITRQRRQCLFGHIRSSKTCAGPGKSAVPSCW